MTATEKTALQIDELFHAYYPAVVRLALSILEDGVSPEVQDEAEDAAQETFIAAARGLEDFEGLSSARTWLFAIAINVCRDILRRRKARRALRFTLELLHFAVGSETVQYQVERSERNAGLWSAVKRLDEKHRLVVVLRYVHALTAPEIGEVLGIPENTVLSRLFYARRKLEGELQHSGGLEEAVTE